jgi:hypothetical protein
MLEDAYLGSRIGKLLEAVLERGVRPCVIYMMARADQLLDQRAEIERLLPAVQAAGHGLRILSIGAENFSPEENERLNKGISVEQVWDCFELLRSLEDRFPGAFRCPDDGYFAAILFTPWTRPDDLRHNFTAARRLGAAWLQRAMGTRLQLRPGVPITELALRDGLVAAEHGSGRDITPVCLSSAEDRELPWRFRDPRVDLAHRLLIRLDPLPEQVRFAQDDPLLLQVRRLRARVSASLRDDYIGCALAIVDAVTALGADATHEEIFDHVARSVPPEASPDAVTAGAPDRRPANPTDRRLEGVLRFEATAPPASEAYRFCVAPHRAGQPYLRRVGDLVLWYEHRDLDRASTAFARLLLAAMKEWGSQPLLLDSVPVWRRNVDKLAQEAGPTRRFSWTVEWA